MPTTPPSDALDNETLGELQGTMLQAILTGTPLPGRKEPIELPDLERLVAQPDVILSAENLGGPLRVRNPSQDLHICLRRPSGSGLAIKPAPSTFGSSRLRRQAAGCCSPW